MAGWLLDTNILSELRRPRPEPKLVEFVRNQPLDLLFVSTVTFAEIRFGIEQVRDAARRAELAAWLANTVRPLFAGRVIEVSEDVLLEWRLVADRGRRAGQASSFPDLLIAASARRLGLTVVSRDAAPYRRAGVPVFDPWTEEVPDYPPP